MVLDAVAPFKRHFDPSIHKVCPQSVDHIAAEDECAAVVSCVLLFHGRCLKRKITKQKHNCSCRLYGSQQGQDYLAKFQCIIFSS